MRRIFGSFVKPDLVEGRRPSRRTNHHEIGQQRSRSQREFPIVSFDGFAQPFLLTFRVQPSQRSQFHHHFRLSRQAIIVLDRAACAARVGEESHTIVGTSGQGQDYSPDSGGQSSFHVGASRRSFVGRSDSGGNPPPHQSHERRNSGTYDTVQDRVKFGIHQGQKI